MVAVGNGKLFFNDEGRVLENHNEEIARRAWIQKEVYIDLTDPGVSFLSVFAYEYTGNEHSLQFRINCFSYSIQPDPRSQGYYRWLVIPLPAGVAKPGWNRIRIAADNLAFHSWIVAIDNGNEAGTSLKSCDQGQTWSGRRLGYDFSLKGEYVIRWYVEANPPCEVPQARPEQTLQPLNHPDLSLYKRMENLPSVCDGAHSDFAVAVRLCSWAADQWTHSNGQIYPPLHLPTLLDWKRKGRGHGGCPDVRGFCVLFAHAFIQACWAMGIHARGVALPSYVDAPPGYGHFVAEAYCKELNKWVMFDADYDLHVSYRNQPLNVGDISEQWHRSGTDGLTIVKGSSFGRNPFGFEFFQNHLHHGGYRLWAIHRHQDYLSRPDRQPVHHGAVNALEYHEPGLIVYDKTLQSRNMFPYVTDEMTLLYYDPTDD